MRTAFNSSSVCLFVCSIGSTNGKRQRNVNNTNPPHHLHGATEGLGGGSDQDHYHRTGGGAGGSSRPSGEGMPFSSAAMEMESILAGMRQAANTPATLF